MKDPYEWKIKDKVEFLFSFQHGLYAGWGEIVSLDPLLLLDSPPCFTLYVVHAFHRPDLNKISLDPLITSGYLYVPKDACKLIDRFPTF